MKHLLTIALLLLLWSCSTDGMPPQPDGAGEETPYVVIRLAIPSMSGETRANPMGGEEGNGREKALANEDRIHDINVFFYNDADDSDAKGLDGDADIPIFHSIYFNLDDRSDPANSSLEAFEAKEEESPYLGVSYVELKFKTTAELPELKEGTNFAVTANIGKLGTLPATLGALRDLDLSSYSSYGQDRFLMSTAFNYDYMDRYGYSTGTNSLSKQKDIYKGVTTLQRLAARIDLWHNAEKNAGITDNDGYASASPSLSYEVEGHSGDKVMLLNALPVNVMQRPSFLFKKVSAQPLTEWTKSALNGVTSFLWAGQETPQGVPTSAPNDCPTNYVFERHTLDKTGNASSDEDETLAEWYGATTLSSVKANIKDPEKGKMSQCPSVKSLKGPYDPDYGCDRVSVIAYAEENIQPIDCFRKEYITGLIFRALYVPEFIYKGYDGETGEAIAISSEETAAFDTSVKLGLYSPTYGRTQSGESKDLVFKDKASAQAYAVRHPEDNAILTEFSAARVDGKLGLECFYSLWLRHYNDENADPQADYPMEYAIVRNNIYRVALEFSGPGTPEPEMREPDTMMSRIFVRKWNLRQESSPLQF